MSAREAVIYAVEGATEAAQAELERAGIRHCLISVVVPLDDGEVQLRFINTLTEAQSPSVNAALDQAAAEAEAREG